MKHLLQIIYKNKRATILIVAILLVGVTAITQMGTSESVSKESEMTTSTAPQFVSVLSVAESQAQNKIESSGNVESQAQAALTAEVGGVVQRVPIEIGDTVAAGDLLVRLDTTDEAAALAQAQASLSAQRARLAELRAGARPQELNNAAINVATAETNLEEARRGFLNTDLQAYLVDEDTYTGRGSLEQPTISGVYRSDEEGEYRLSVYRSGTQSGYSFRYSGLESGVSPVSSDTPQPLGERGLYVEFPVDFAASMDVEWVVPIPNTRSLQYNQAESSLQRAKQALRQAQNNLEIAESGARSEQVQAQEASVAQAEANVVAAQARLTKKTIRAPFSGEVTAVHARVGEQISSGQSVAEVVNTNSLQVTTFVSGAAARSITIGDEVVIDDQYSGVVTAVAPAIGQQSGKVEVKVRLTDQNAELIVGDFVSVDIIASSNTSNELTVPLTAVKNDTRGAYVLQISEDNMAQRVAVETGSIRGDSIVITAGLERVEEIIADIRSISVGDVVERE